MEVPVKNQNGETVETVDLDDAVFSVPMNHSLVHQALVIYQANKRQGTHDTKTRAQVSGGGRKPWTQKHTGRARQGSIRAPQWRHGGVVFGPHPRDYRMALPRRMRRYALRCVLSDKARKQRFICLDTMDQVDGKTKSMVDLLAKLGVSGSTLLVTLGSEENVIQAAHNLKKVWTMPVNLLNAENLLTRENLIMTLEAARWAERVLSVEIHRRRDKVLAGEAAPTPAVEAGPAEPVEEEDRAVNSVEPPVEQAEASAAEAANEPEETSGEA